MCVTETYFPVSELNEAVNHLTESHVKFYISGNLIAYNNEKWVLQPVMPRIGYLVEKSLPSRSSL